MDGVRQEVEISSRASAIGKVGYLVIGCLSNFYLVGRRTEAVLESGHW